MITEIRGRSADGFAGARMGVRLSRSHGEFYFVELNPHQVHVKRGNRSGRRFSTSSKRRLASTSRPAPGPVKSRT